MIQKKERLGAVAFVKKYDYCIIFLLSFLYIRWDVLGQGNGFGVALFALLFCGFVRLRLAPIPQKRLCQARPWGLVVAASAFYALWFDKTPFGWVNMVFLSVCAMYWMMILSGRRIREEAGDWMLTDLLCQMIRVPFSNFGRLFWKSAESFRRFKEDRKNEGGESHHARLCEAAWAGFAIVLAFPLFFLVLKLLSAADEDFMKLISSLIKGIEKVWERVMTAQLAKALWELVFAVPVAAYLYGAIWGNAHPQEAGGWEKEEIASLRLRRMRIAPASAVYAALALFLGAYVLFLLLQATHLLKALRLGLPETLTYSRFAREGFFELCAVCAINLGLMVAAQLFCRKGEGRPPRAWKAVFFILSCQTALLAVTAQIKMGLYIRAYGLTRLRVYTAWFIFWLLAVFFVLALAQLKSLPTGKLLATISVVMFLLLGYANVDALIVKENLARYEANKISLEQLNVKGLASLCADGRLELLRYCEEEAEKGASLKKMRAVRQIRRAINQRQAETKEKPWYCLNAGELRLKYRQSVDSVNFPPL